MKFLAHLFACVAFSLALVGLAEEKASEPVSKASDEEKNAATNDAETVATAVDPKFERYLTILDRMPFGREPPGFNPDAPQATAGGGTASMVLRVRPQRPKKSNGSSLPCAFPC